MSPDVLLLLICAPAGTGKSILLADWVRRRCESPRRGIEAAWLTVTPDLGQAHQFWAALRARFGIAANTHACAAAPLQDGADLVAALADRAAPIALVIDDAHLITDPIALAGLEYFLKNAPHTLTVIVAGRFDPPLRWHSFELAGQLLRVPAADMAMSSDQVAQICRQHLPALTGEELEVLTGLTRGWAALVRIAAIYLAGHPHDRTAALTTLARPDQAISDFLVGELIDTLPPGLRMFLAYTSIPDSFTEQLADELTGGGAGHWLSELARINFPVTQDVQGDGLWFGYHPMLRAYLRAEASRLGQAVIADIHLRTSEWLRANNQPLAALPHLLTGPDTPHLRGFLADVAIELVLEGQGGGLFATLLRVRPEIADDPYLWLLRALDAVLYGNPTDAQPILEVVRTRRATQTSFVPAAWIEALSLATATDIEVMTGMAVPEFHLPDGSRPSTGHAGIDCYATIQAAMSDVLGGNRTRGEAMLASALALAEHTGRLRLAVRAATRLASAAGIRGDITGMRKRAEKALSLVAESAAAENPDIAQALTMSALSAYLQGDDPDPNQMRAALAVHPRQDGCPVPVAGRHAHVVGSLLEFEHSTDRFAAADALRHSLLELLDKQAVAVTSSGLVPHTVWALLKVQEPRTARLLVDRARRVLGEVPDIVLSQAALAHVARHPEAVRSLVRPLVRSDDALHPVTAVSAWLLYSLANSGRPLVAREGLENALRCAARGNLVRPFLDVPGAIQLLDQFAGRLGRHEAFSEYVRRHPKSRRSTALPILTTTELVVLRQLPSGRTAKQIADDLGVSINTVKTHLRGIYAKLGSNSRVTALDQARHVGLL